MIDVQSFSSAQPSDAQARRDTPSAIHNHPLFSLGQTQQAPLVKTRAGPLTLAQKKRSVVPVGIIGAGVSGLYAALILQSLGIPCEILEATERVGGRVFTHRFSTQKYDYFVSHPSI